MSIANEVPINPSACFCQPFNEENVTDWKYADSLVFETGKGDDISVWHGIENTTNIVNPCTFKKTIDGYETSFPGEESIGCRYEPNVFFMSVLLFFGTYVLAMTLKKETEVDFDTFIRYSIKLAIRKSGQLQRRGAKIQRKYGGI